MKTIEVTDEQFEFLKTIQHELKTQTNRGTSHPQFNVFRTDKCTQLLTGCLTMKGAEEYIRTDGHNYPKAYIYVTSGHRNYEWIRLRALLSALNLQPSTVTP